MSSFTSKAQICHSLNNLTSCNISGSKTYLSAGLIWLCQFINEPGNKSTISLPRRLSFTWSYIILEIKASHLTSIHTLHYMPYQAEAIQTMMALPIRLKTGRRRSAATPPIWIFIGAVQTEVIRHLKKFYNEYSLVQSSAVQCLQCSE